MEYKEPWWASGKALVVVVVLFMISAAGLIWSVGEMVQRAAEAWKP
jgi:hypothetical protein